RAAVTATLTTTAAQPKTSSAMTTPAAMSRRRSVRKVIMGEYTGRSAAPRAEQPVAGVAQAREDVTACIELTIERRGVDRHIRMGLEHGAHPLWGGHKAQEPDPRGPGGLEGVHAGDGRPSGGEHGVQDEEGAVPLVTRNFEVVVDRLQTLMVAIHA